MIKSIKIILKYYNVKDYKIKTLGEKINIYLIEPSYFLINELLSISENIEVLFL